MRSKGLSPARDQAWLALRVQRTRTMTPACSPQRARVVPRSGGPFSQNTGVAGVVQGIRLSVRAGHALIAANDDWDEEAQAQTLQSLGLARSDAGESAPLRVLEPSRCPERGSS